MNCLLVLSLAVLGTVSAGVVAPVDVVGNLGPTISETVVSPFHRTDAITGPCSKTVVHTTTTTTNGLPLRRNGFFGAGFAGRGASFLSGTSGIFHGPLNGVTGMNTFSGPVLAGHRGGAFFGGLGNGVLGRGPFDMDIAQEGFLGGPFPAGHYGYGNGLIA